MSDFTSCSVNIDQPGFYVSDIDRLASSVVNVMGDSVVRTLPEEVVVWDSTVTFEPGFSNVTISAVPPPAFDPDPWSGDEQDLYSAEIGIGITFPSSVYDPSINLEFPGGFLKPAPPLITYNVEPYIPPLNIDIPPLSLPDISFPYLALPDMDITNITKRIKGLKRVNIHFNDMCMSVVDSFASNSTIEDVNISWDAPSNGLYVLMASNGRCVWKAISPC